MNAIRLYVKSNHIAYLCRLCGLYHDLIFTGLYCDLIMNTLEDRVDQGTLEDTFLRRYQFHVLGSDDYIYGLILTETGIYTVKTGTQDFYQTISDHGGPDDITVTDKIGNESIFRFIIDALGSTDLLDIPLVHDYDGIGHGQSLFLVMGDIDKGNAKLVLQADKLILHVLAKLQIQGA